MPILSCNARTCMYNVEECCSKGDIQVAGEEAVRADETCCNSFCERVGTAMVNSTSCGCKTVGVECEATCCRFNEDEKCDAGKVAIAGSSACNCDETRCGTFQKK
ncbi:MAG: DUF1540 domain-containing protein [Niameybacter sp.]